MNTKKITINAILLGIGALLHQITPALGLPMQPDFSLMMLFIIMILNKNDYKVTLTASIITGLFTAMTTKFPGGQIPNFIDKVVTANIIYFIMFALDKINILNKLGEQKRKNIILLIVFPFGTLISGSIFLLSALVIVGLPASFTVLFVAVVLPATIINLFAGMFLYNIVELSLKRVRA